MFREDYKRLYGQIRPDTRLIGQTVRKVQKEQEKNVYSVQQRRAPHNPARRITACVAAACICVLVAVPGLAAKVDPVYEALYAVFPAAAQFFRPVNETDEMNGIRMQVTSAYIHGSTAEICLTMQDLTGDRIDGTTDLYDSYRLNCPFDSAANCEFLNYEEETKTASFLVRIESQGEKIVNGDKVTFSVREFLSKKKEYEGVEIPADLSAVPENTAVQKVELSGAGGFDVERYVEEDTADMLVPEAADGEFPVEGVSLTGIGYVDGNLRIQLKMEERLEYDTHGEVYLKDGDGNEIRCENILYFGGGYTHGSSSEDGDYAVDGDYCEYVFDVPQEELGNCTLYGDFVKAGMRTEGGWQVTFPLEKNSLEEIE